MKTKPKRIVAEICKNWPEQTAGLLSERFEKVIQVNESRGYELESWQLSASAFPESECAGAAKQETIIAVFNLRHT